MQRLLLLVILAASPLAHATQYTCPHPAKHRDGVIAVHTETSQDHVNYRIDFPRQLDGRNLSFAQLFIGNQSNSWVMTTLNPVPSDLRGTAGKLVSFVDTKGNRSPISVVAFYGVPPFCSTISKAIVRK